MTAVEMLPILREWDAKERELSVRLAEACELLGCSMESPLWDAILDVSNAHTAAVSQIVGDKAEWLEYFRTECSHGARPQRIEWGDGRAIMLDSVEALAEVIAS